MIVVYSDIAVKAVKPPPDTEHHTLTLTSAIVGISGWLAAIVLWFTRQSKPKVASSETN